MAHQLQICVDLRPDSSFRDHRVPVRGRRTRTRNTRPRLQAHAGLSASREPTLSTDFRVPFAQLGNGMPSSSVAVPGYSSLLQRNKGQDIQAGDGFMKVAEWVYRKVKDPMVEIDPVTVDQKIRTEEETAREDQETKEKQVIEQDECKPTDSSEDTIATVVPATSLYLPLEFSRLNASTKAAVVAVFLAAVSLAYLGFRSKSALSKRKQNSEFVPTSPGRAGIGGKRDSGTSRVIHYSSCNKESSPSQDLHEQFRYSSDGDSSDKAVASRASAELTSWQFQTTGTPGPAVPSQAKKTTFPSSQSATPHGSNKEEEENAVGSEDSSFSESSSDSDFPLANSFDEIGAVNGTGHDSSPAGFAQSQEEAKSFEEVVAVNGVGHYSSPAGVAESEKGARPFEEVVAVNHVGHDTNSVEVEESEKGAKPFEEVVAVNRMGHDNNPTEVAESEKDAKPFGEVIVVSSVGHDSSPAKVAGTETNAVEFQNAFIFDEPQASKGSWKGFRPKKDIRPTFEEEHTSVTSVPEITMEPSSTQLVEDLLVSNLDDDFPAQLVKEDGPVRETLNGGVATASDAQAEEEKRKSYAEAIQAVVPAIAVGAGALSTMSGVSSGFEMVGLVATASFLARELIMASTRQQLFGDFSKVKDHKSFLEFLQKRQIINSRGQA